MPQRVSLPWGVSDILMDIFFIFEILEICVKKEIFRSLEKFVSKKQLCEFHTMQKLYVLHIYDRAAIEKNKKRIDIYVVLPGLGVLQPVLSPPLSWHHFQGRLYYQRRERFSKVQSRYTAFGRRQDLRRVCGEWCTVQPI